MGVLNSTEEGVALRSLAFPALRVNKGATLEAGLQQFTFGKEKNIPSVRLLSEVIQSRIKRGEA